MRTSIRIVAYIIWALLWLFSLGVFKSWVDSEQAVVVQKLAGKSEAEVRAGANRWGTESGIIYGAITLFFFGGFVVITRKTSKKQSSLKVENEKIYAKVADELENGNIDKGLWTRLFTECNGDEKQTKILYIKQRSDRLIEEENLQIEIDAKESANKAEILEKINRERDGLADPDLIYAVWNGNINTVSKLLRDGIKPIGKDKDGNSLLDLAKNRKDKQMIELLKSYDAT